MPALTFDALAAGIAFLVCLVAYPFLIRWFGRAGFRQVIQAELPPEHQRKAGTPTGGGIVFVAVGVAGGLLSLRAHWGAVPMATALVLYGLLGLVDDLRKLSVGAIGIPARIKFPLQLVLAVPVAWLAHAPQHGLPASAGWLYWPLAVVAIAGAANAVNLTDGIDGLAGGLSVIALVTLALIVPGAPPGARAVAMTLAGGLVAFLVYNRYPARIFMGDTGALGLGAAMAAVALQQGWVLALLGVGLVFVMETLSVMIQVGYFKATRGRRVFPNTPIHLTFQEWGWPETRIAYTFWSAGLTAALITGWITRSIA